jgi:hypothetical protein
MMKVTMKSTFGHSARTNQWGWEIPLDRGLLPTPLTIIFCQRNGFYHRRKSLRIDRFAAVPLLRKATSE